MAQSPEKAPEGMAPPSDTMGEMVMAALPDAVVLIDKHNRFRLLNLSAEVLFSASAAVLEDQRLNDLVPFSSPLLALIDQARLREAVVSEYGVALSGPKLRAHSVDIQVSPLGESWDDLVVTFRERSVAQKIDHQLLHRGAARSVMGMSRILAHEIKNPLSGIKGAAQLVEGELDSASRELTQLICRESDRICALIDRLESFSDRHPIERMPVNIHQILGHVRKVAQSGFAHHVTFVENYDPSLPPVLGDSDLLIQVFLNLVKNAAEAVPREEGEITLTTAYRHGVRLAVPGSRERLQLPLEICVIDNGPGVSEDIKPYLFDPFVSAKSSGTGLGLALVAKLIGDHSGVIEHDEVSEKTVFRVLLPAFQGEAETEDSSS